MQTESTTQVLWRQAKAGDRTAYERLFGLHVDRALMFIRIRLGSELREKMDPEDVLQDAYLAAHRDFERFEYTDDGAFLRWLCRIIDNRIRDWNDHFQARKRQPVEIPRSNPTGPVTAFHRAENREKVERALEHLTADQRLAVLLRYFEGLSAEETAERMNRTAGAVRKLTARALSEMGKYL